MNTLMQLTPHFTLEEMERSSRAQELGIPNHAGPEEIANLRHLCQEVLEPLRAYADEPIIISSGYRSPPVNQAVGGAATSQHQKGEAADIKIPCVTSADGTVKQDLKTARRWLAWLMDNTRFDQLILERNQSGFYWIHVSLKRVGVNRQSCILGLVKR